ncbi:hypothetical protein RB195_011501 [Necator americanus]|uniref:Uncharacterized protein n=1 Tax=Necator americanus TaxID=51031 RepID=A0ABR1D4S8_NECAM
MDILWLVSLAYVVKNLNRFFTTTGTGDRRAVPLRIYQSKTPILTFPANSITTSDLCEYVTSPRNARHCDNADPLINE